MRPPGEGRREEAESLAWWQRGPEERTLHGSYWHFPLNPFNSTNSTQPTNDSSLPLPRSLVLEMALIRSNVCLQLYQGSSPTLAQFKHPPNTSHLPNLTSCTEGSSFLLTSALYSMQNSRLTVSNVPLNPLVKMQIPLRK